MKERDEPSCHFTSKEKIRIVLFEFQFFTVILSDSIVMAFVDLVIDKKRKTLTGYDASYSLIEPTPARINDGNNITTLQLTTTEMLPPESDYMFTTVKPGNNALVKPRYMFSCPPTCTQHPPLHYVRPTPTRRIFKVKEIPLERDVSIDLKAVLVEWFNGDARSRRFKMHTVAHYEQSPTDPDDVLKTMIEVPDPNWARFSIVPFRTFAKTARDLLRHLKEKTGRPLTDLEKKDGFFSETPQLHNIMYNWTLLTIKSSPWTTYGTVKRELSSLNSEVKLFDRAIRNCPDALTVIELSNSRLNKIARIHYLTTLMEKITAKNVMGEWEDTYLPAETHPVAEVTKDYLYIHTKWLQDNSYYLANVPPAPPVPSPQYTLKPMPIISPRPSILRARHIRTHTVPSL